MKEFIIILNFHVTNSILVSRMLRSNKIYSKVYPGSTEVRAVNTEGCKGIIIVGDYAGSVLGIQTDSMWLKLGLPVLAIGSAAAAINLMYGGKVSEGIAVNSSQVLNFNTDKNNFLSKHNEAMVRARKLFPGENMDCFAKTEDDVCVDVCHKQLEIYGTQRVLERNDPESFELILGFAIDLCLCAQSWDIKEFIVDEIDKIKEKYKNHNVICAVSGGIDSIVSTVIAKQAFGDNVKCIIINNGFFRLNEVKELTNFFENYLKVPIINVDASDAFLNEIKNISENSKKEIAIRKLIKITLTNESRKFDDNTLVITGTNYNDILFNSSNFEIIDDSNDHDDELKSYQPLANLFKFEVRNLASYFMLPEEIVNKQPFPSSGLALRVLGEVNKDNLNLLKGIDDVFVREINENKLSKKLWRYYSIITPYPGFNDMYSVILRAVQNSQNKTAYAFRMPYDLLERVTEKLKYTYPQIRHVLYDVTPSESFNILE